MVQFLVKNCRIIISSIAVALWFHALSRMFDLAFPKLNWTKCMLMIMMATIVLVLDDGHLLELGNYEPAVATIMSGRREKDFDN